MADLEFRIRVKIASKFSCTDCCDKMVALLYAMLLDTMCKIVIRRLISFLSPSALEIESDSCWIKVLQLFESKCN